MNDRNKERVLPGTMCLVLTLCWLGVGSLVAQEPPITDLAFSPDGKTLISCSQRGLRVFSWPELQLQKEISAFADNLHCLSFSPNEDLLAVGGGNPSEDGSVAIYAWPSFAPKFNLSSSKDSVVAFAWRNESQLIAASLDRTLVLWDLETQSAVQTFSGHSRGVTAACVLEPGEIVSAGHDQSVRVWSAESGELIRSMNQHSKPIHAIAACPNATGRPLIATASRDRSIRFWQPTIGRMMRYVRLESEPLDIAWIDEKQLLAGCIDGQVRVVDFENVSVSRAIPAIQGWAYAVAIHPSDGSFAAGGSDGQIFRIDL
ncbi:WD40 repeat domain-containing protein [Rubripirellula sp.]|nr:WD40 repeat domain-containing protein [Rubripirellula sp.]MDF1844162.1 WD40 repeat domain-containing protein [Rubripirellula sp.]